MKRFVYTLQSVLGYKQTLEKARKADLSKAQSYLRELREQERMLDEAFERNAEAQIEALSRPSTDIAREMEKYDAYFRYLREAKKELAEMIVKAEEEKERCLALVVEVMKEIKTYENLREEQYTRYLEEVRREEAKDIGDLVSFQTVTQERV